MDNAPYSLWLLLPPRERERYVERITSLSQWLGTPVFEPHITLSPRFDRPEAEALRITETIARELAPMTVSLNAVGIADTYFRCVFLRAERTAELLAANALGCATTGLAPETDYLPHISLVYGSLDRSLQEPLAAELSREVPASFEVTHLALCHIVGPPNAWRIVASFELSGES